MTFSALSSVKGMDIKMKKLTLTEIHDETVIVLKEFHDLCEKLDLTYYLAYGTLSGAIRHKGFIPWDDDADVWMPREDYEKFIKYCVEKKSDIKPYEINNREVTKNYYYGMARFSNTNFIYETTSYEKPVEIGVFIDIYPLDNYGENENQATSILKNCKRMNRIYSAYNNPSGRNVILKIVRPFVWGYAHIVYGKNYHKKIDKKIADYIKKNTDKKDKYIGIPAWSLENEPQLFEKKWFEDKIKTEFEGLSLYIPKGWDNLLKVSYGDYMELPPEEERHPYHSYNIYKKE